MLTILVGSQTGNALNLALGISGQLSADGIDNECFPMDEIDPETIHELQKLFIVTSTYGDGEAPDNASEWLSFLKFSELDLSHLEYAVLGLGDNYYPHFCQCAKDFDQYLARQGAKQLLERLDCDLYYEEQYPEWVEKLKQVL
jgi:sulfite reductase (NADPH) flavoprotein alpha-component